MSCVTVHPDDKKNVDVLQYYSAIVVAVRPNQCTNGGISWIQSTPLFSSITFLAISAIVTYWKTQWLAPGLAGSD